MAPNEFTDYNEHLGFFNSDPESVDFLSVDKEYETFDLFLDYTDETMPYLEVYTVFSLLGDIGGFNGAIIILPAYFMAIYSERMYNA